jgi:hypothetical protein
MLTANELNAEMDGRLDELGKSKKGDSQMNVLSDMMGSSQGRSGLSLNDS